MLWLTILTLVRSINCIRSSAVLPITEFGRSPYHPRMMLKAVLYAYMNNIYSCRKIEKSLLRDIHFIWLAGYEKPDYRTINRFRNRVKDEINGIFTQIVLILASKGFISLDVEYVDGTKIESKANRYTFVWRKNVERNRARLLEKIRILLQQIDEVVVTVPGFLRRYVFFYSRLMRSWHRRMPALKIPLPSLPLLCWRI